MLTPEAKTTIQKICERVGHEQFIGSTTICFCKWANMSSVFNTQDNCTALGFLGEKDTLVAVFGEGIVKIGRNIEDVELETIQGLPAWQYHGREMVGLSLSERLAYYAKYL